MERPDADYVRSILDYDPETGDFYWKTRPDATFRWWNALYAGKRAGHTNSAIGYWHITVKGRKVRAHHLAWLITTGEWPSKYIDHVNGITTDNRITNLRLADRDENLQNRPAQINNKSGWKGIWFDKRGRKKPWCASLTVSGRKIALGAHATPEAAHEAYRHAAIRFHGDFANAAPPPMGVSGPAPVAKQTLGGS